MTLVNANFAIGVRAQPWTTGNEEMLTALLMSAEMSFDRLEADSKGVDGDFRKHIAELVRIINNRQDRRSAEKNRETAPEIAFNDREHARQFAKAHNDFFARERQRARPDRRPIAAVCISVLALAIAVAAIQGVSL
ncbi:hypothetical protein K1W69_17285 [Hoeflea sp. WL0058]|uniref:Uncharacterized protein n=1 Tax=Flavimaribacter sediminis TaxID=2865987 RepID=A0AAE2ZR80_9HYPH|nr:hypothetical protein [Flavimaribacter sediminis]MBW8638953.1 hypothetical protein [Flavimaribacter sediminis]